MESLSNYLAFEMKNKMIELLPWYCKFVIKIFIQIRYVPGSSHNYPGITIRMTALVVYIS